MVRGQHLPWDAVEPKCMEGGGAQKLKWKGRGTHMPPPTLWRARGTLMGGGRWGEGGAGGGAGSSMKLRWAGS